MMEQVLGTGRDPVPGEVIRGGGLGYPFLFGGWSRMDGGDWQVIGVLAVLMVGVSVGLAKAYQSPQPQVIATFDYAYLVFAAFWGFAFFGEIPNSWTLTGMALIAAAGMVVLHAGMRARKAGVAPS